MQFSWLQPITNPEQKTRRGEFRDEPHNIADQFHEVLRSALGEELLRNKMGELIQKDPNFYSLYFVLSDLWSRERKELRSMEVLFNGRERAVRRIADKEGNFPELISWRHPENRHIIVIITRWAGELWQQREVEASLELYSNFSGLIQVTKLARDTRY